jgi:predicted ATPase
MAIAQRGQNAALLLQAHHALWSVLALASPNELELTLAHTEAGIALYEPQQHHRQAAQYGGHDPCICARCVAAGHWWLLGYPERAHRSVQEALRLAEQLDHPPSLVSALTNGASTYARRREPDRVLALMSRAVSITTKQELPLAAAAVKMLQGWALAMQGETARGLTQLRQGITEWQALGVVVRRAYNLLWLAEAYWKAGQAEAGLATIDEALALAETHHDHYWDAELHRVRGALLLTAGRPAADAETAFQQALAIARRQKAKSLELRATTRLARLWQRQGRGAEAHPLLAEVYNWFTEGFGTGDLQEAKALLDELQATAPQVSIV